jgi:hypothetical protein
MVRGDDAPGRVRQRRAAPAGADATSVRVRAGETLVSDGPFAETKDLVGGFVLVECRHPDEAIEVAAPIVGRPRHPVARHGIVEVRPVWE